MIAAEIAAHKAGTLLFAVDTLLETLRTHPDGAKEEFARLALEGLRPYAQQAELATAVALDVARLP